jgi:hypothetical protein
MANNVDLKNLSYAEWLEKTLQELVTFPVKKIGIYAMTENGEVYNNYHNVSMADKLVIAGIIQQDAMLDTMAANGMLEYVDDEDEDEEDYGEEKK